MDHVAGKYRDYFIVYVSIRRHFNFNSIPDGSNIFVRYDIVRQHVPCPTLSLCSILVGFLWCHISNFFYLESCFMIGRGVGMH